MSAAPLHLLLAGALSMGACVALDIDTEEWDEIDELDDIDEWDEDSLAEPVARAASDEIDLPSWSHVDVVTHASEPPELFVEIISPMDGATVAAGTSISAFGGPGWAVPEMELYMDGLQTSSIDNFNVTFEIDRATPEGSHTFTAQFTCTLASCAGQTASASITLTITAAEHDPNDSDPGNPDDPDDIGGPGGPGDPDDPTNSGFGSTGCAAAGSSSHGHGFVLLLGLFVLMRRRQGAA